MVNNRYKVRKCPCGNELPIRRFKYCCNDCQLTHGNPKQYKDQQPITKARIALKKVKWAKDKTLEQLILWYSIK